MSGVLPYPRGHLVIDYPHLAVSIHSKKAKSRIKLLFAICQHLIEAANNTCVEYPICTQLLLQLNAHFYY
jgi:hypothetical protein